MSSYEFPKALRRCRPSEEPEACIPLEGDVCTKFCQVPFERLLDLVDLEASRLVEDLVIVLPGGRGALLARGNTPLCLAELSANESYVLFREGDVISEGEVFAYTVSRSGRVRKHRSPCAGVVLAVIDLSWETPRRQLLLTVGPNDVRRIAIGGR
ncbi:MAG: DUF2118 domain-containing protein [Desulfurococcaceae archaeon]